MKKIILVSLSAVLMSGCASMQDKINKILVPPSNSSTGQAQPAPVSNTSDDSMASMKDYQDFSAKISKYDYEAKSAIKAELSMVNSKVKSVKISDEDINRLADLYIPMLNKNELEKLSEKIAKECKPATSDVKYAFLKIIYLHGDVPEISIEKVAEKPIKVKCGGDYTGKFPLGIYPVEIKAKYKKPLKTVFVALLENDLAEIYVLTDKKGEILNLCGNLCVLPTSIGVLEVVTAKSGVSFTLESEWLIAKELDAGEPNENEGINVPADEGANLGIPGIPNPMEKKVNSKPKTNAKADDPIDAEMMARLKETNPGIYNILNSKIVERPKLSRIFWRLLRSERGEKTIMLPAPIILLVPAGEYKVNGKDVIVEGDAFKLLDLDETQKKTEVKPEAKTVPKEKDSISTKKETKTGKSATPTPSDKTTQ